MLYDKDIREPLLEYLELEYGKIRMIEEKRMGKSRADMVMVTEEALVGIEIKSDADSYVRLAGQVRDYDKYFRYNIVAVGGSHGLQIHKHVPEHWGIITVDEEAGRPDFYFLRRPTVNQNRQFVNVMKLLWKPELALLQQKYQLPKYANKSREFIAEKLLTRIPELFTEETLEREICELLFERDYTVYDRAAEAERTAERQTSIEEQMEALGKGRKTKSAFRAKAERGRRTERGKKYIKL